jgi:hypothetical protein
MVEFALPECVKINFGKADEHLREGWTAVAHSPARIDDRLESVIKDNLFGSGGARTTADSPALCATQRLLHQYTIM